MVRSIVSMVGAFVILLHGSPGLGSPSRVAKPSNASARSSRSIPQVVNALKAGMSYQQVVSILGKSGRKAPGHAFIARWSRTGNYKITVVVVNGKITTREMVGNWEAKVKPVKTYAEIRKLLGEPTTKGSVTYYQWQYDTQACKVTVQFVNGHALNRGYVCQNGGSGVNLSFSMDSIGSVHLPSSASKQ